MKVKFANEDKLKAMRLNHQKLPRRSREFHKMDLAILKEEYRIDSYNCWAASINHRNKDK